MADSTIVLPATGSGTATPPISVKNLTSLNGGVVSSQAVERIALTRFTGASAGEDYQALTDTELRATPVPFSAASLPLPTGAATSAKQDSEITLLGTIDTSVAAINLKTPSLVSGRVPVDGSGVTQPISAAALPLPTGASTLAEQQTQTTALSAIQAAVQIMDDWDESDRAKVNPIAGQAGVQGGAGASTALTQRVAIATDANVVAGGGTAGSAATGVVTVQGIASMTPVQVSQATASNFNAQIVGNVAHDATDSGNPVKTGTRAVAFGSAPDDVSAGERADMIGSLEGLLFMFDTHPNVITRRDNYTAAQTDTAIVTVSSGSRIIVFEEDADTDLDNTVKTQVRIGFGGTNTPTGAGVILTHPGLVPGGGKKELRIRVGGDGEDLRITSSVPTGGSLDVTSCYAIAPA